MSEVTSKSAARGLSDVLNRVAFGRERIVITRRGRPLAVLCPVDESQLEGSTAPAKDEAHTDLKGAA